MPVSCDVRVGGTFRVRDEERTPFEEDILDDLESCAVAL